MSTYSGDTKPKCDSKESRKPHNGQLLAFFIALRLLSVLCVQTYFVPDEYYQSLEVSHKLVFGYGHMTWEWKEGLRSYVYPLIFTALYKLLYFAGIDHPSMLIYLPRLLQAVLTAYADYCFCLWCDGPKSKVKSWSSFCISTSWFLFYTGSRTIINTVEYALTAIALYKFPWLGKYGEMDFAFMWIAFVTCVLRPTAVVIWLPLFYFHLFYVCDRSKWKKIVLYYYLPAGLFVLLVSTVVDSVAHGEFVFTPLNFVIFNFVNDLGQWYGTEPWHYYLAVIPALLGVFTYQFLKGALRITSNYRSYLNEFYILLSIIVTVLCYSLISHKEIRFMLPILPHFLYIVSKQLEIFTRKAQTWRIYVLVVTVSITNIVPTLYFGLLHQRGPLDVMQPLRHVALNNPENTTFFFLTSCHSTPMYSHLHVNVSTRILSCDPPLPQYLSQPDYDGFETDEFFDDPSQWLLKNFPEEYPSHLVLFDTIKVKISDRYEVLYKVLHSYSPLRRCGSYIYILELKGTGEEGGGAVREGWTAGEGGAVYHGVVGRGTRRGILFILYIVQFSFFWYDLPL